MRRLLRIGLVTRLYREVSSVMFAELSCCCDASVAVFERLNELVCFLLEADRAAVTGLTLGSYETVVSSCMLGREAPAEGGRSSYLFL